MNDAILKYIGKPMADVPAGAETEFIWAHAPQSWHVFLFGGVAIALFYAVYWLYRRDSGCPARWRIPLAGIRVAVFLLVMLIFLGPSLSVSVKSVVEPVILLLLDDSLSMSIRDPYPNREQAERMARMLGKDVAELRNNPPSRAELVEHILTDPASSFIPGLAERGRVQIATFSDKPVLRDIIGAAVPGDGEIAPAALALTRGEPVPPITPDGPLTDIGRALSESMASASGSPVSAVVLISDGQETRSDAHADQLISDSDVPIFTVAVGDPNEAFNLNISDLWVPARVPIGDPFQIQAQVKLTGAPRDVFTVELIVQNADDAVSSGDSAVVAERIHVEFADKELRKTVSFRYRPEIAGEYLFSVRIPEKPGEIITSDNIKKARVEIIDQKIKVLMIAGSPTWDYRFIRNLYTRDSTIDLACWQESLSKRLEQDGNITLDRLPDTQEELFEYDAVIFLDADPGSFRNGWMDMLEKFVEQQAGGILWMAGSKYSADFLQLPRTSGISKLLPVVCMPHVGNSTEQRFWTREWPIHLEASGLDHPILKIAEDISAIRNYWASMPGVFWSFAAKSAKPATQVLISHSDSSLGEPGSDYEGRRPLLVLGRYGAGTTAYLGFDSTWRWRRFSEDHFDHFWIQMIRTLTDGRRMRGRRRGRITLDKAIYTSGDRIDVSARLFDPEFNPLQVQEIKAAVESPDGKRVTFSLKGRTETPGHYTGSLLARAIGINKISVDPDGGGGDDSMVSTSYQVTLPNVEFEDPRANIPLLQALAERSEGAFFDIASCSALPEKIPVKRETIVVHDKPITLWDSARVMILLVFLLCCEWIIRKRLRML